MFVVGHTDIPVGHKPAQASFGGMQVFVMTQGTFRKWRKGN